MKKLLSIILVSVMTMAAYHTSKAQDLEVGVRAGLNVATVTGQGVIDPVFVPGFHLGAFGRIGLAEKIFLQPELLIASKGFGYNSDKGTYEYRWRESLYYIDIPVLLGINLTEQAHLLAGLQPSFLIAARYRENVPKASGPNSNEYSKGNLGLVAGLHYKLENGLDLGLRLTYDLTRTFNNSRKGYNTVIMFTVGYAFLKK